MVYEQQNLIFHSSGGWKFKIRVPAWSGSCEGHLLGCRLPTHMAERGQELSGDPFIRALIPLMRAPSIWPNYLQKAPPPKIITSGVRISTYEFWEETSIWPITNFSNKNLWDASYNIVIYLQITNAIMLWRELSLIIIISNNNTIYIAPFILNILKTSCKRIISDV